MDTSQRRAAIKVEVETAYLPDQSDPAAPRYVFAYTITIRNNGKVPATLLTHFTLEQLQAIREHRRCAIKSARHYIPSLHI